MGVKRKRDEDADDESNDERFLGKKTEEFSLPNFRKGLKGENCFGVLKDLLRHSKFVGESEKNTITQLLESGGGANDIIHLLTTGKATLPSQYAVVFQALHAVIMGTLTAVPIKQSEIEQACHQLLSAQLHTIHSMISEKGNVRHKKIVLRLLTGMISLSVTLAREILSHVTFTPSVVDALTQHSKHTDKLSVRTCFIHFLLAFLVEGNFAIIRPLLDKKGLLASIVPGLKQDNADLVVLVLTTLRTKLVENSNISKTIKLHLFNTQVMHSLLELYTWKGPIAWTPKAKQHHMESSVIHEQANSDDGLMVAEAVHELLIVLCSSYKYGVAFHDRSLGTSSLRHNQLIFTVLQRIERPWEKERTSDLIICTLKACPDLLRNMLPGWESSFEPRASKSWIQAIRLIKQILSSLDAEEYLKPCIENLSQTQILSAIRTLTVPASVLSTAGVCGLQHQYTSVRQEVVNLLVTMLSQLGKTLAAIKTWNLLKTTEVLKLKQGLVSYLNKYLPSGDVVYAAWERELIPTARNTEDNIDPLPIACLSSRQNDLLDLLLLYQKCCPHMVGHLDFTEFFVKIHEEDLGEVEEPSDDNDKASILVKVLQLLLATDISALSPDKVQFREVFLQLFTLSRHTSQSVCKPASHTLVTLLRGTGLFVGSGDELNVWLHCYRAVPAESCDNVIHFMTSVVTHTIQNLTHYTDCITQAKEEDGNGAMHLHDLLNNRMDDILTELMEDDLKENELADSSVFIELSPLLACALEMAESDPTDEVIHFLSCVVVHLLHSQPFPTAVINLACRWSHLPSAVAKYLQSWNSSNVPASLKKPFSANSLESRLSRTLLQAEDTPFEFPQEDPIHDVLLFKLALFHVSQLASRSQLSEVTCKTSKRIFKQLFDAILEIDPKNEPESLSVTCLKSALAHPVILQFFNPLHKRKHVVEKLITELTVEFLKLAFRLFENRGDISLFIPFRRKLLSSIIWLARHPGKFVRGSELVPSAAQLLHLQKSDITEIISHLTMLPVNSLFVPDIGLSTWGLLLVHLLQKVEEPLTDNTVASLVKYVVELDGKDSEIAMSFRQYFICFPHSMALVSPEMFKALLHIPGGVAALLLERNASFTSVFTSHVLNTKKLISKPELFFPLLSAALLHAEDEIVLTVTYEQYQSVIDQAISRPHETHDWMKEHIETMKMLINKSMDGDTCRQICKKLLKEYVKFDRCDRFHLALVETVFKCSSSSGIELILVNQLAKHLDDDMDPSEVCQYLLEFLNTDNSCAEVRQSEVWSSLPGCMLRSGLAKDGYPILLTTLSKIIDKMCAEEIIFKEANFIFEMVLSHSEFLNIILGSDSAAKRGLVELILTLTKSNPKILQKKHISIILGSYGATLSGTDQILLQASGSMFPENPDVYDPAFLLPLFSHLLAPESIVYTHKVNQCGALALTVAALASGCSDIRAAAGHILARYYDQLDAGRSGKEERLLMQFISAIRGGFSKLMEDEDDHKITIVPQLPGVTTTFLARASLIMSQPLHPLYVPLHEFILTKPALDLRSVPEFLALFRNDNVEFRLYRLWILEVLRDGLQNKQDLEVSSRHAVFKLIMDLYSCVLADYDTKVLILEVLNSALKLPTAVSQFVSNHGLVAWLHHNIDQLIPPVNSQPISTIISILNLVQSSSAGVYDHLILTLLLLMLPLIPPSLPEIEFCNYLKCVLKNESIGSLKSDNIMAMIKVAKTILGSVGDCEQLLDFGCQYAAVDRRKEDKIGVVILRKITLLWLQKTQTSV